MKKTLKTLCMTIFEITMPLFMLVGIALVLIQTMAIFSGNGACWCGYGRRYIPGLLMLQVSVCLLHLFSVM